MATYKIKSKAVQHIQKGGRLVKVKDFVNEDRVQHLVEGDVVTLKDTNNQFIANFIVGRQNKGLGWVITTDPEDYWSEGLAYYLIQEAIESRSSYFSDSATTAFRLFNGEGDGIGGVTIDWYKEYLQINWYSQGIYQFKEWIVSALIELLPNAVGIYETIRFQVEDSEYQIQHIYGSEAPQPLVVQENGINYAVYLGEEWMTGIFMDQREVRQFIQTQGHGMSLLNLFSYTGAFSVAGALGGSPYTVSVDVAKRSLPRTEEQFNLNQIEPDRSKHEIRVMDVFDYVSYAKKHHLQFDVVVCDPPSFARTKKYQFAVNTDYKALAEDLFTLTKPNGMTIISTNHSGYKLDDFRQDILETAENHQGQFHLIQQFGLPGDYPTTEDDESQYLKVLVFYRADVTRS